MNYTIPNFVIFTVGMIAGSISAQTTNFSWDGGGSNTKFENPLNWSSGTLPVSKSKKSVQILLENGGTVTFDSTSGNWTINKMDISNGSVFNLMGGTLDHGQSGAVVRFNIGLAGRGSTVNQSDGNMLVGHMIRVGHKEASGTYNLSGGVLDIYRAGRSLIGSPAGPSLSLGPGNADAEMNISGGSLISRFGVEIDSKATFKVLGTGASKIGIGLSERDGFGSWYQKGTLSVGVGPKGATKIEIIGNASKDQFVTFLSGSVLDLSFHGTKPYSGTWTILEVENANIVDEGLLLSTATRADPNWSFEIDNTGRVGRLNAKYVDIPEPKSFALVLGGICMLAMLRRRA